MKRAAPLVGLTVLLLSVVVQGQNMAATGLAVVPPLVNFSGTLIDLNGKPLSGTVGVTFALYREQTEGAPLWLETQNVTADSRGHYSVMLGSTTNTGLPADIFVAGEARWLAVQPQGQAEQPRVLLLSVPYALKAGDAQTLGGLPASAFVLAAPPNSAAPIPASASAATAQLSSPAPPPPSTDVTTSGGTVNAIPLFSTGTDIENSILTQAGGSEINVAGKLNLPGTGTATASGGKTSRPLTFVTSVFNSTTSTAVPQMFQWQAEPAGNDTATPSGTLNLLFRSGSATPAETGLQLASNGVITFASGQTFPGTGTITGITAGTGLTGGGASGNVTLNLNTTQIPTLSSANTFTGNQTVNGSVSATSSSSNGILGSTSSSSGYGVEGVGTGLGANTGVYGTSPNGVGVQGFSPNGVAGLFSTTAGGTLIEGTVGGSTRFAVDNLGNVTANGMVTASNTVTGNGTNANGVGVQGISIGASGFGVAGTSPNVGVYGNSANIGVDGHGGAVGVKGVATAGGGLSGLFQGGPVNVGGNNSALLIGDPGCGSGYAGIGVTTGSLSNCTNYALIGGPSGDTYVNSSGSGALHFRNNNGGSNANGDLATIDTAGNLTVAGTVHSGNAWGIATANSNVYASGGACTTDLELTPNSNCQTPGMSVTVTTFGGPVLITADIGGVDIDDNVTYSNCAAANFLLVMDSQFIAAKTYYFNDESGQYFDAHLTAVQAPAAGTHTFQVQEWDDNSACGSGKYSPTYVGVGDDQFSGRADFSASATSTRTLFVREF